MTINTAQTKADYFSFSGRLGKKKFQSSFLVLFLIAVLIFPLALMLAFSLTPIIASPLFLILIPLRLLLLIAFFSIIVRRLHDIGQSGWLSLLLFLPLINLIMVIYLLVTDGSGPNSYGIL